MLFTMGLADNPRIVQKLIESRMSGHTMKEIASDVDVSEATVSRSLAKPVVRHLLEKAYTDLCSLAPKVTEVYSDAIAGKSEDLDERKFRLSAAKDVSAMIGLSPVRDSHNNVFFTNIIAPTAVTLSPMVAKLLDKLADSSVDEDTVDVEYVE